MGLDLDVPAAGETRLLKRESASLSTLFCLFIALASVFIKSSLQRIASVIDIALSTILG